MFSLGPPSIVHCKYVKKCTVQTFWKQPFQNQPKSVIGYVRQLGQSPKVGQAIQLELTPPQFSERQDDHNTSTQM